MSENATNVNAFVAFAMNADKEDMVEVPPINSRRFFFKYCIVIYLIILP